MTIDQCRAHIGGDVIYLPRGGSAESAEKGIIVSVSDCWAFVRYGSRIASAATDPADLTLLAAR